MADDLLWGKALETEGDGAGFRIVENMTRSIDLSKSGQMLGPPHAHLEDILGHTA